MANVVVYNCFKTGMMAGTYNNIATGAKQVFLALLNNSYTPDIDAHNFVGQFIGTYQINGTNYTSGGHALSAPTLTENTTTDSGVFDAGDFVLGSVTFGTAPRYGVLYSSTGSGFAADPLIAYVDFSADKPVSNGTFTITWNASGIISAT